MGDLSEALRAWKEKHGAELVGGGQEEKGRERRASNKVPSKPAAAPSEPALERPLSDAELFRRAIKELPDPAGAILAKYDRHDPGAAAPKAQPVGENEAPPAEGEVTASDRALFLQAVGEVTRDAAAEQKREGGKRRRRRR